jgi:hypothetical protein
MSAQLCGHINPKSFSGFQIDDQIEFCRLHDWQFCGLFALEYSADIDPRQAIAILKARGVTQESSRRSELTKGVDGGHRVPRGQCD